MWRGSGLPAACQSRILPGRSRAIMKTILSEWRRAGFIRSAKRKRMIGHLLFSTVLVGLIVEAGDVIPFQGRLTPLADSKLRMRAGNMPVRNRVLRAGAEPVGSSSVFLSKTRLFAATTQAGADARLAASITSDF